VIFAAHAPSSPTTGERPTRSQRPDHRSVPGSAAAPIQRRPPVCHPRPLRQPAAQAGEALAVAAIPLVRIITASQHVGSRVHSARKMVGGCPIQEHGWRRGEAARRSLYPVKCHGASERLRRPRTRWATASSRHPARGGVGASLTPPCDAVPASLSSLPAGMAARHRGPT
jgi:hypothetical protein